MADLWVCFAAKNGLRVAVPADRVEVIYQHAVGVVRIKTTDDRTAWATESGVSVLDTFEAAAFVSTPLARTVEV